MALVCSAMAASGFSVSAESYTCPLCGDILQDPVTIPCGDTYCLECIKIFWDQSDHMGIYSCPQCRVTFSQRPPLRHMRSSTVDERLRNLPAPTSSPFSLRSSPMEKKDTGSLCDFCTGQRNKAVKSCLVCLAYYCEIHIQPHYESPSFKRHKLVDETGNLDRKICPQHGKGLELFCRSDQVCVCALCTVREHRGHNIVSAEEERAEKQKTLTATQAEGQYVIQERMKELQELNHNVDTLRSSAQRAVVDSEQIFTEIVRAAERWRSEIGCLIEANEQAAMTQAQGHVERLEQEIVERQQKDMEVRHILDTEDNVHFLQNFPSLCAPPALIVPKVLVNPDFSFGDVTKTVADIREHLEDTCKRDMSKITKSVNETPVFILLPRNGENPVKVPSKPALQEPKTRADFLKYSCQMTLDPNTAYKELVLSDGYRKATRKKVVHLYADHPERFDGFSQVLCKEPLSRSRYYWEVLWTGEFSVGVAYKSISRKGKNSHSLLGYNDKSWSLLCSDTGYSAWHNKVDKELQNQPRASRIGVYLDYAGGSLGFYAVSQSMALIYRFHAKFTEPLYAGFGVGSTVTLCQMSER